MIRLLILLSLFVGLAQPTRAATNDKEDIYLTPKLVAVQNRSYNVNKNLSVLLGYLPDDAFSKGVTLGGVFTYYFSDFTAWEVVNANYVFKQDTGLKKDLAGFNVQVENERLLDFIQYYATTNLVYTPLYNKHLLFNKSVVYGEQSFVIGGGVGKFEQAGMMPIVGGGLIFKYFITKSSSIKLDAREWVYFDSVKGMDGILDLKIGYDMLIGDTPRSED